LSRGIAINYGVSAVCYVKINVTSSATDHSIHNN
jgi:hypothetical protein